MAELCSEMLGNPSSLHRAGRQARFHLEQARERCANALGAKVEEIVFCSGATEADNLALWGVLTHPESRHRHLITSELEHAAVFETARSIASCHKDGVGWMRVDKQARIDLGSLREHLGGLGPSLVSVMAVNNEVGSRQPLAEVTELCREYGALLHVDAVQEPYAARELISGGGADLVTLSGHKMGGLPGGLLYVRQGVPLGAQILGGAQEDGRRAGTSEVLRSVALALALEQTLGGSHQQLQQIRDDFERPLANLPGAVRLGPEPSQERAPHISSWLFGELAAEPILAQLDLRGVCASSGSACSSHAIEPSRVIKAMGRAEQAMGLVRFSFGWKTSLDELRRAAEIVEETVEKMTMKVKR